MFSVCTLLIKKYEELGQMELDKPWLRNCIKKILLQKVDRDLRSGKRPLVASISLGTTD